MNIDSTFQLLLSGAAAQQEPQRLLFVFTTAELPEDASPQQREQFAAGHGGTLTPRVCVDKAPAELSSFAALRAESAEAGPPWHVVFIAALSGQGGMPPTQTRIEQALQAMVDRIRGGRIEGLLALDHEGRPLSFG
ncbi:MAG TPA: ribonucleotide reductase subunit alpha [Roseateles sp.]|nr:ribonucleotide reductase subunit alpha [Roseateles sp.]